MKKVIGILFITMCISTVGYSQFTKGKIMIGGSFSANFDANKYKNGGTTTKESTTNSFGLYPQVGYFFMDNLAAGAGLSLGSSTTKSGSNKFIYTTTYLSPFARYYFGNIYGQLAFDLGSSKAKTETNNTTTTTKTNGSGWSLAAGYAYLLNDHVAIEPQLGYGLNYTQADPGKDIQGGLFIKVGIQVYIGK